MTAIYALGAGVLLSVSIAAAQSAPRAPTRHDVTLAQSLIERLPGADQLTPGQRNLLLSQYVMRLALGEPLDERPAPEDTRPLSLPSHRPSADRPWLPPAESLPFPFSDAVFNDNFSKTVKKLEAGKMEALVWGGTSACDDPELFKECVEVFAVSGNTTSPGSGVVIGRRAILVAAHTVAGATSVSVNFACKSGSEVKCDVVMPLGESPKHSDGRPWDLAVLLIKEPLPAGVIIPPPPRITEPGWIDSCDVPAITAVGYGANDVFGSFGYGTRRIAQGMVVLSKNCTPQPVCPPQPPREDPVRDFGCIAQMEVVANAARVDGHRLDTCPGDSGGPMYFQDAAGNYVLAGVVRGSRSGGQAKCGHGGRYTRIDDPAVLAWIKSFATK